MPGLQVEAGQVGHASYRRGGQGPFRQRRKKHLRGGRSRWEDANGTIRSIAPVLTAKIGYTAQTLING